MRNGSTDFTVPFGLSFATTTSPPIFFVLFQEPCRAMKMALTVFSREHAARVEAHAERRTVRAEQGDGLDELIARVAPTDFAVREVPLVTVREAEMLASLGDTVELVLGEVL